MNENAKRKPGRPEVCPGVETARRTVVLPMTTIEGIKKYAKMHKISKPEATRQLLEWAVHNVFDLEKMLP